MTYVRVTGGTNAGWRNPFNGAAMPWQCDCKQPGLPMHGALRKTNPGYLARCTSCGTRRPS